MVNLAARLRRELFEPLYTLKQKSPKLKYWRRLEQTQYLPREMLEAIQRRRFLDLWEFVWRNNEFYRYRFAEWGLTPGSLKDIGDIGKLPILTKKEIRAAGEGMISAGHRKERLLHFKTGGSTGKALDIYMTEACSELRNACARRHDRWAGWQPGEPVGAVWGNPHLPTTWKAKLLNSLVQPYIYLDTMALTDNSVKAFAEQWLNHRPTLLFGHAHSLFVLAQYGERVDISPIRPRGIISTSMMLLPHERRGIEQGFGCPVTDRYGCEEVSLIGSQCEHHQGFHMNIEHLIIEFLKDDGTPAAPGEPGRIIVTDLMNKAMPFIRYSVEDIGTPIGTCCPCGRGLPLMGGVAGRVADFLIRKDGTKVAGVSIIENTLTKISGIDQMQLVQEDMDTLVIHIVPGKEYGAHTEHEVKAYFESLFGGTRVQLNRTVEIKPEASGKFRFAICKVS